MPRENRICIALFNTLHNLIKNWTTWNFSRLFFNKLKGDVQIFSLGIVSQFSELCLNTQNLFVLDISGLASIQKEFFIFHIIVHSNKNSFCISGKANAVKIASDFEPPPRRKISARQRAKNSEFVGKNGGKSVGCASRVPPSGFEKAVGFCIGARERICTSTPLRAPPPQGSLATITTPARIENYSATLAVTSSVSLSAF